MDYEDVDTGGHYEVGDHLVQPGAFGISDVYHHALYIGNGKVIHYNSKPDVTQWDKGAAEVRIDDVRTVEQKAKDVGGTVKVRRHKNRLADGEAVERCASRLEENHYDLFKNNCEHLVNWCVTGNPVSHQTRAQAPWTPLDPERFPDLQEWNDNHGVTLL